MRHWRRIISLLYCSVMILSLAVLPQTRTSAADTPSMDFRAVWVSTVLNLDYPSAGTPNAGTLRAQADAILDGARAMGLNAVILQVRPTADAFYKSDLFPWSAYLTGEAGKAPSDGFDPLAYWVEGAHKRGLELHAWINPYRITRTSAGDADPRVSDLPEGHPARKNPAWTVTGEDGNLYFNPGIAEVRRLIIDGALEIVNRYDVDGIHLDDYFYPSQTFADSATYKASGTTLSLDNWRRSNVDALVQELDTALHAARPDIRFGISPFGIWANKKTVSQGSDTNGGESYTQHYADTRKWVKLGWVDYIAPQIYWHIGHKTADYATLVRWWAETVRGTGVDLYIGHAVYRVGGAGENAAWDTPAEVTRQLTMNTRYTEVSGSIFFRYQHMAKTAGLSDAVQAFYRQGGDLATSGTSVTGEYTLSVGRPETDTSTNLSKFYIGGSSDAGQPLYLNGEQIFARSAQGFFGMLVDLKVGKNTFTFTQDGEKVTRTITRTKDTKATASPASMSKATVLDAYPSANVYAKPGAKLTLSCTAPIGATVKVSFGGKSYTMTPAVKKAPDTKKIYQTTYTCTYTVPAKQGGVSLGTLGKPAYSMTYKGKTVKASGADILLYRTTDNVYATLAADVVPAYNRASSTGGPAFEMSRGMRDRVTDISGSYAKLGSGLWVALSNLSLDTKSSGASVSGTVYTPYAQGAWDALTVRTPAGAGTAFYDEKNAVITFTVSPADAAPLPQLPDNGIFSSVSAKVSGGSAVYTLKLSGAPVLGGYYVEKTQDGVTLYIRERLAAKTGAWPLSGHTIMIDPGHGGSDTGALGLLGTDAPEKMINMQNSLALKEQLESLGARVLLTRTDDVKLELADRVALSRAEKPDLFVSMHANSMNNDVDMSKISGYAVYYRENISSAAAGALFDRAGADLGLGNKGKHQSNLYVGRGTWAPALIFESAFMANPYDFEWLMTPANRTHLARTVAQAIVDYFTV